MEVLRKSLEYIILFSCYLLKLGIDDIEFQSIGPQSCVFFPISALPSIKTTARPTTTLTTTTTQPTIVELDCDFESECSWTNAQTNPSNVNWIITEVFRPSSNYKPSEDHSLNSGLGSILIIQPAYINRIKIAYDSPPMNGTKCGNVFIQLFF
jgi:hypothetical protein